MLHYWAIRHHSLCLSPSVLVRPAYYCVNQCPVATSTGDGANGEPGRSALLPVGAGPHSESDSVIILLLRVGGGAVWAWPSNRENATPTPAQVNGYLMLTPPIPAAA